MNIELSKPNRKFSLEYDQALILASLSHNLQVRKQTLVPYLIHPTHVSRILEQYGYEPELVIAGLLHDVLEDTDYNSSQIIESFRQTFAFFYEHLPLDSLPEKVERTLEEFIEHAFGTKVLKLVVAVTDPKVENDARSWRERKTEQMAHLDQADHDHAVLKAADLLHNMESILFRMETSGEAAFSCFAGDSNAVDVPWYYCESAKKVISILGSTTPISKELTEVIKRFRI